MNILKLLSSSYGGEIKFVGGKSVGFAGTTSNMVISITDLTGGIDTQPSQGDIVIVFNSSGGADESVIANTVIGYTLAWDLASTDTYRVKAKMQYAIMGSTPDTSITIAGGTSSIINAGACSIAVFRGIDQVSPFDNSITDGGINSGRPNPPAITPVTQGSYIVCMGAAANQYTLLTNSEYDLDFLAKGDDLYDCATAMGIKKWLGGTFDPTYWESSIDSNEFAWVSVSATLKPA